MPDVLAIRYDRESAGVATVLWLELKRIDKNGRATKAKPHQKQWHIAERARGALTLIAGEDFPATIDGFIEWYRRSGLQRCRR